MQGIEKFELGRAGNGRTFTFIYWGLTGLMALAIAASGLFDLSQNEEFMATLDKLGYPAYLATILGVAKLLAAVAIIAPLGRTLKEWAYAGIAIDLIGAIISHLVVGDSPATLTPVIFLLVLTAASYLVWRRRLEKEEREA